MLGVIYDIMKNSVIGGEGNNVRSDNIFGGGGVKAVIGILKVRENDCGAGVCIGFPVDTGGASEKLAIFKSGLAIGSIGEMDGGGTADLKGGVIKGSGGFRGIIGVIGKIVFIGCFQMAIIEIDAHTGSGIFNRTAFVFIDDLNAVKIGVIIA